VTILGASGSIGTNAIEFLRLHPDPFRLHSWGVRMAIAPNLLSRSASRRDADQETDRVNANRGLDSIIKIVLDLRHRKCRRDTESEGVAGSNPVVEIPFSRNQTLTTIRRT
jgi:hypothetical protein